MFDFKFDWEESISVGISEIDEQHQELFRIGRDIEQLILTQCQGVTEEEVLKKLCEIRDYTTYHFYMEEQLIEKINKEQLEEHRSQHETFRKIINEINCIQLIKSPTEEFREIKTFLQEWLFQHILVEDKLAFTPRIE